jgi:DNA-binding MarR family transcriptional regulator
VRRDPDPRDARGTLLSLTEDGEKVVGLLRQRLATLLGQRLAGWPPEQAGAFVAGLDRFVRELRDAL